MDAQTIQKTIQQQKLESIFLVDVQCQQSWDLTIKKKHKLYRRKDCMKKFCKSLTEHTKVGFKKKKMQPLPKKELKSHEDASMLYLRKKFQ